MITSNCVVCNCLFEKNSSTQKVCCLECKIKWRKIRDKNNQLKKNLNKISAVCQFCNNNFEFTPRKNRKNRIFCSRSCASKNYIEKGTFDAWRLRKNEKTGKDIPCDECGKLNYVTLCYLLKQEHHFCDRDCLSSFLSKKFSGSGNPMFNKPLSTESKQKQLNTLYKNHKVKNAFALAKRRTKSKPQIEIYDFIIENEFFDFCIEKRVICDQKEYYADIISFSRKLIIEFNGGYFHCDPRLYCDSYFNELKKKSAAAIWEEDLIRLNNLQISGYNIFVVWEYDFLHNKLHVLNELLRWINEEKNSNVLRSSVDLADVKSGELLETSKITNATVELETVNANA